MPHVEPPSCPPNTVYAPVRESRGGYVCVPSATAAAPAPAPAAGDCVALDAKGPEVPILARADPLPTLGEELPPDGSYVLVRASRDLAGDGGAVPTTVRGALTVAGARLVLGIAASAAESFELTYASGGLTKVCAVAPSAFAASFLPGPDETSYPATLSWDAGAATLAMRFGVLELVWARVT